MKKKDFIIIIIIIYIVIIIESVCDENHIGECVRCIKHNPPTPTMVCFKNAHNTYTPTHTPTNTPTHTPTNTPTHTSHKL